MGDSSSKVITLSDNNDISSSEKVDGQPNAVVERSTLGSIHMMMLTSRQEVVTTKNASPVTGTEETSATLDKSSASGISELASHQQSAITTEGVDMNVGTTNSVSMDADNSTPTAEKQGPSDEATDATEPMTDDESAKVTEGAVVTFAELSKTGEEELQEDEKEKAETKNESVGVLSGLLDGYGSSDEEEEEEVEAEVDTPLPTSGNMETNDSSSAEQRSSAMEFKQEISIEEGKSSEEQGEETKADTPSDALDVRGHSEERMETEEVSTDVPAANQLTEPEIHRETSATEAEEPADAQMEPGKENEEPEEQEEGIPDLSSHNSELCKDKETLVEKGKEGNDRSEEENFVTRQDKDAKPPKEKTSSDAEAEQNEKMVPEKEIEGIEIAQTKAQSIHHDASRGSHDDEMHRSEVMEVEEKKGSEENNSTTKQSENEKPPREQVNDERVQADKEIGPEKKREPPMSHETKRVSKEPSEMTAHTDDKMELENEEDKHADEDKATSEKDYNMKPLMEQSEDADTLANEEMGSEKESEDCTRKSDNIKQDQPFQEDVEKKPEGESKLVDQHETSKEGVSEQSTHQKNDKDSRKQGTEEREESQETEDKQPPTVSVKGIDNSNSGKQEKTSMDDMKRSLEATSDEESKTEDCQNLVTSDGMKSDEGITTDEDTKSDNDQDRKELKYLKTDGETASDEEAKAEKGNEGRKPPLHRLMLDYKARKEQAYRENREKARKSGRPKRETERYVPGPASIFLNPEKQRLKKKALGQAKEKIKKRQVVIKEKPTFRFSRDQHKREKTETEKPNKAAMDSKVSSQPSNLTILLKPKLEVVLKPSTAEPQRGVAKPATDTLKPMEKATKPAVPQPEPGMQDTTPGAPKPEGKAVKATAPISVLSHDSALGDSQTPRSKSRPSGEAARPKEKEPEIQQTVGYYPHAIDVQMDCQGKKFPEQLMLMMKKEVAEESLWWSSEGGGSTFVVDCAWFRDCIMRAFFPNNPFKRITHTLKRWGFQRNYIDLPDGIMAFHHPLFKRDQPELASKIVRPAYKPYKARIVKGRQSEDELAPEQPRQASTQNNVTTAAREDIRRQRDVAECARKRAREQMHAERRGSRTALSESDVPPSVRIAALRREGSCGSQDPPSSGSGAASKRKKRPSFQLAPVRLAKKEPEVVDLTEEGDDQNAHMNRDTKQYTGEQWLGVAYLPPRPAGFTPGQKQRLHSYGDFRSSKYRMVAMQKASSTSHRGLSSPETPQQHTERRVSRPSFVTPDRANNSFRENEIVQRLAKDWEEDDRRQQQRDVKNKRRGSSGQRSASHSSQRKALHAPAPTMQELAMARAMDEEHALRMKNRESIVLQQEQRVMERALLRRAQHRQQQQVMAHDDEAERRQRLASALRKQQQVVEHDEEAERRKRLASALFGSGRPAEKKQKVEPKPAPKPTPKPAQSKEAPASSKQSKPKAAPAKSPAPSARSPPLSAPVSRPAPLPSTTQPTQLPAFAARQPDPTLAAQVELLNAISNPLLGRNNVMANTQALDPLVSLLQSQLQPQPQPQFQAHPQDLARLSGLLQSAVGGYSAPQPTLPGQPTLEELLVLSALQQR